MSKFIATKLNPEISTIDCPLHIGLFDAGSHHWPEKAAAWLGEMRGLGLGCSGCHTLQVETRRRTAVFHLLVCEPASNPPPIPGAPSRISDCLEVGSKFGHVVVANCEQFPPAIRVLEDFWSDPSEGNSHFDDEIMPLMKKILSDFCEKENSWEK